MVMVGCKGRVFGSVATDALIGGFGASSKLFHFLNDGRRTQHLVIMVLIDTCTTPFTDAPPSH